jgi:O-succinylbenzoate synthase
MNLKLKLRLYSRPFRSPLHSRHGIWTHREGVILHLQDDMDHSGWGEIAPLPWFGTESLDTALTFCRELAADCTKMAIASIPDTLPACQFGLESALEWLQQASQQASLSKSLSPKSISYLLPGGESALTAWKQPWQQGYRTFKWKIGTSYLIAHLTDELGWFGQLVNMLPPGAQLRLDANGGLDWEAACRWLELCDRLSTASSNHCSIEFIEQPLSPGQETAMMQLQQQFQTPIALDESVASVSHLETWERRGWRGIFVVKPAIAGSPQQLRQFCQQHLQTPIVWSSALETPVARQFIFHHLLPSVPQQKRALGFGTGQWFNDHMDQQESVVAIWQSL